MSNSLSILIAVFGFILVGPMVAAALIGEVTVLFGWVIGLSLFVGLAA